MIHSPSQFYGLFGLSDQVSYPEGMLKRRVASGEGLGALGPLGNASSIAAGAYKVTGTGVNQRNVALASTGQMLNIGDDFTADGGVKGTEVNGVYTNFASGTSRLGPGYVAVEYLAPAAGFQQASYQPGGGGGTIQPVSKTTVTTTTTTETTWMDYVPYAIGALAVGGLAYALFFTKKGQAHRRLARARYRKYSGMGRR
jgi:hypothetical protein